MDNINYILRIKKGLYNYYKYKLQEEQPQILQEEYDINLLRKLFNTYNISEIKLLEYENKQIYN